MLPTARSPSAGSKDWSVSVASSGEGVSAAPEPSAEQRLFSGPLRRTRNPFWKFSLREGFAFRGAGPGQVFAIGRFSASTTPQFDARNVMNSVQAQAQKFHLLRDAKTRPRLLQCENPRSPGPNNPRQPAAHILTAAFASLLGVHAEALTVCATCSLSRFEHRGVLPRARRRPAGCRPLRTAWRSPASWRSRCPRRRSWPAVPAAFRRAHRGRRRARNRSPG